MDDCLLSCGLLFVIFCICRYDISCVYVFVNVARQKMASKN